MTKPYRKKKKEGVRNKNLIFCLWGHERRQGVKRVEWHEGWDDSQFCLNAWAESDTNTVCQSPQAADGHTLLDPYTASSPSSLYTLSLQLSSHSDCLGIKAHTGSSSHLMPNVFYPHSIMCRLLSVFCADSLTSQPENEPLQWNMWNEIQVKADFRLFIVRIAYLIYSQ